MIRLTLVLVVLGMLTGGPGIAGQKAVATELLATPAPASTFSQPPVIFGSLGKGLLPILMPTPSIRECTTHEAQTYCGSASCDCIKTAYNVFCFC